MKFIMETYKKLNMKKSKDLIYLFQQAVMELIQKY